MDFALVIRELWQRKAIVAVGVLVAAVAAVLSVYRFDGLTLKARQMQHSGASTQILVDTPSSVLGSTSESLDPLDARAIVYANFMASPAVLEVIASQVGLHGNQLYAAGPVDTLQPRTVQEPTELKRNVQITGESAPYRLNFNSDPNLPTIGVFAQAPTTAEAVALANASVVGLKRYVTGLEKTDNVPASQRVVIRQLGQASGGVTDAGISKSLAAIVFFAALVLWCIVVLVGVRFRANWRASGHIAAGESLDARDLVHSNGNGNGNGNSDRIPAPLAASQQADGDAAAQGEQGEPAWVVRGDPPARSGW
jgi:hypothetical protein